MKGKFVKGVLTGALLGTAAGMMLIPNMNRKNRKRFVRAGKYFSGVVNNLWDDLTYRRK